MLRTKNQSRVSISGLTYNNLLEDAYNALKDSDAFKDNFTDFTSNTAERMIVELYAYMATQLATRLDQMGNELFVDTASASGMSRLLKLVGAKIDFPSAASVDVSVTTSSNTDRIRFTSGINADGGNTLNYVSGAFKSVTANNGTNWEFIDYKVGDDGEYVYDYTTQYNFDAPSQDFTIYEGTTHSLDYTVRSTNIDIITLSGSPVIKNSVRVYYKQKVTKSGTSNAYEIVEFKKVDNFFTTEALTAKVGVFTERNAGNGKCELCLKPYSSDSETDIGKELLIMYRTGGGENGNLSIGAIDKTERFTIIGDSARVTGYGQLNIYNTTTGSGGRNELTTDQIRATVLQEVRNTKIAVTEEDYEYLLPKYDSEIELIKCYGEKSSDVAELAETYGYYVNPITVWLIILKYNKEFYDAYINDETGLTDRINDIAFSVLDINPRFNEKYQINRAYLNQVYKNSELSQYLSPATNTYSFPIDQKGVEILKSGNAKITVTNYPYIESSAASKRGVNCFKEYDSLTGIKTWEELLALATASKGNVYLISDSDYYEEVGNRWECIEDYSGVALDNENVLDYWQKVDFSYIYDNLVSDDLSEDRCYIQESTSSADYHPVYSYASYSFSGLWSKLRESWAYSTEGIQIPAGEPIYLTINGVQIVIQGGTIFETAQDFCDMINARVAAETQIIFLKQNISINPTEDPINVNLPSSGISSVSFTLVTGETTSNITVNTSGITNYGALIDALNDAIPSDKYLAVWIENNECWNLGIICATPFTYRDNAESLSTNSALYVNLLDNEEPEEWPLESSDFTLTAAQAQEFESYLSPGSETEMAKVDENGRITLGFDNDGECSLQIQSVDGAKASILREFFNLDPTESDASTLLNKRTITVQFNESTVSTATVQISMLSASDVLSGDVYINIFGGVNSQIRLGEYYENIDEYLPDVSSVVRNLLKRGPISHLYSTSYITSGFENVVDKYDSDYQLKMSAGLIEEQTFNQMSAGNSPAQIDTLRIKGDSMPYYAEGNKLYMKVDNIEYNGAGSFTVNGTTHVVPEKNGYAEFDLSWFNNCSTSNFVDSIIKVFKEQGPATDDLSATPLLKETDNLDNTLKIYTISSAFYSSIDFGSTLPSVITDLFGISESVVHSKEGQIDVKQIKYKYYPLTSFLAIGNELNITITPKDQTPISADINIGYSIVDFTGNVADSTVGEYVVVDNNRIVLTDLLNGTKIKVRVEWEDNIHYLSWEGMFTPDTWAAFTKTGTEESGYAELEFVNDGDYYIDLREEEGQNNYYLIVQNEYAFPYGDIYFHMYEDYSIDHIVSETGNDVVYTDEYNWNNLMLDRKVMLTEHIYKQPRFIPFDLAITCYLPNTETYSQIDYQKEIANYLRTEYGLYSNNIGQEISPDEIIFNIKENFSKIIKITIDYLGYDMRNSATNKESLTTKFNQKHILASTESSTGTVVDPETGFITVQENIISHGLKITLKYRAA